MIIKVCNKCSSSSEEVLLHKNNITLALSPILIIYIFLISSDILIIVFKEIGCDIYIILFHFLYYLNNFLIKYHIYFVSLEKNLII